jgi:hypothetical protein
VLLEAMRAHYAAGRLDEAAEIAKDAAPYLHRKTLRVPFLERLAAKAVAFRRRSCHRRTSPAGAAAASGA